MQCSARHAYALVAVWATEARGVIFNTLYYWGTPAKLLHWVGAAMILFLYFHGLWIGDAPPPSVPGEPASNAGQVFFHAAVGVTLGLLMAGRYLWRIANKIPMLPAKTPTWEKRLAALAHLGLYVATAIAIVSGWLLAGVRTPAVDVQLFGFIKVPTFAISSNKASIETLDFVHEVAAHFLIVMVVFHVFAALWHHFVQQDSVLKRMLLRGRNNRPQQR